METNFIQINIEQSPFLELADRYRVLCDVCTELFTMVNYPNAPLLPPEIVQNTLEVVMSRCGLRERETDPLTAWLSDTKDRINSGE